MHPMSDRSLGKKRGVGPAPAIGRCVVALDGLVGAVEDMAMLARLCRDMPRFMRAREPRWGPGGTPAAAAGEHIRRRLDARAARFLALVECYVYGWPASPYRRLLRAAGCELGDLRTLVAREGVEGALAHLAAAGVYITFDEFKERVPIVRGSERFTVTERDFDTPGLRPHFTAYSSGSGGPPSPVKTHLRFVADLAWDTAAALDAHGLSHTAHVLWLTAGVTPLLIYTALGRPPVAWWYPTLPLPPKVRAGAWLLAALGRLAGCALPLPHYLDLRAPAVLARWLAHQRQPVCVTTYASSAVRVCLAARDLGLHLGHVAFITLGEPFTAAKRALFAAVGARPLVRYAFTEGGILAYACAVPDAPDDLHLLSHAYALVCRRRPLPGTGEPVEALLVTSLRMCPPKVLLNVENGDTAILTTRACGCALGALGLNTHLSTVRSFEKLSSEGMTFARADLLRVLEEALPARIGGTAADYQVVERDGADGISRLELLVSPRLGPLDEARVRAVFLEELGRVGVGEQLAAAFWQRAGTVTVRRSPPLATRAGKVLPFLVLKEPREEATVSGRPSS
jgi:hypothetical protein